MSRPLSTFVAVLALITMASRAPSNATIMTLDAVSNSPTELSNFNITFDDNNGDNLFIFSELVAFSGVVYTDAGGPRNFSTILSVPSIPGISIASGAVIGSQWTFGLIGPDQLTAPVESWSYNVTPTNAVPIPAVGTGVPGLAFLTAGLITWWRRRARVREATGDPTIARTYHAIPISP